MLFVITCRAWKALFQEKEERKKKRLLNWKERRQEKKERENNMAGKCNVEKKSDKWE